MTCPAFAPGGKVTLVDVSIDAEITLDAHTVISIFVEI
jgi:hypothetical protein